MSRWAAEFEDLMMFLMGALGAMGEIQLQTRVAPAAVIDVADGGMKCSA
jgi:uncharacterized membrane protein YgdD (TMEM256/DUF423 family)